MAKWITKIAKTGKADKAEFAKAGLTEKQVAEKLTYKFLRLSETKAFASFKSEIESAVINLADKCANIPDADLNRNIGEALSTLANRLLEVADSVTVQADAARKLSGLNFAEKVTTAKPDDEENTDVDL